MKALNRISSARARGFSLLEVLIAVAILTFGLLALASLQLTLIRSSADAKAQTTASALAKEKIEQLRDYQDMTQYRTDIVDEADEAINDVGGSLGGVNYERDTVVQRFVYNKTDNAFDLVADTATDATITALADNHILGKDFKRVRVSVSWANAAGESQTISLEDVIDSLDPVETALVAKPPSSASSVRQVKKKIFDPAADKMVIPMALGDGVNTAATNPKPTVLSGTQTVETRFDVLTYNGVSGGTATVQARVETRIVACTCDITTKPASTVRGKRPSYWNGKRYTVPSDVADYSPPAGLAALATGEQRSDSCGICCRDHHDPEGVTGATFSPLRVTKVNGIVESPHTHHLDSVTTAEATAKYKESCRVVRSDGVLAVATDLQSDYFGLVATGDGSTAGTFLPDTTSELGDPVVIEGGAVARYQQFVLDYMATRFVTPTPASGAEQTTYNTVGAPATMATSDVYELDEPTSITIASTDTTGKWLHARGLYVDYLEQEAVDAITLAKLDTACNTAITGPPAKTKEEVLRQCVLRLLPFTSINLTELADWSPVTFPLKVTNASYHTSASVTTPLRGNVTSDSANGAFSATATSRKSNSGLLDLFVEAISPDDATPVTTAQTFTAGSGPPTPPSASSFKVVATVPSGFAGTLAVSYKSTVTSGPSGTCSPDTSTTTVLYDFICDPGSSVTNGLGIAGGIQIVVGTYNTAVPTTATATLTCAYSGPSTLLGSQSHTPTVGYTTNVCNDYAVNSAANSTTGDAVASSDIDPTNDPLSAEFTTITYPPVNAGNTLTVVFTAAPVSTSTKVPVCTYACRNGENNFGTACKNPSPIYQFALAAAPVCP